MRTNSNWSEKHREARFDCPEFDQRDNAIPPHLVQKRRKKPPAKARTTPERQARTKGTSQPSSSSRARVVARDGRLCRYCGTYLDEQDLTLDHVVPRSKGGTNAQVNLAVCCAPCNSDKGDDDLGIATHKTGRVMVLRPPCLPR